MSLHTKKSNEFAAQWARLAQETPDEVRALICELVGLHASELANLFYDNMLSDSEAKQYLDNQVVNERLHASMQQWLRELFITGQASSEEIYKHQRHVGEIHARMQIPVTLVLRGARMLKQGIHQHLVSSNLDRSDLVKAINFVNETMEITMDVMTDSFVIDVEKHAREDESYRMFALGQNMLAERERQRAALLEWAQHILLTLLAESDERELQDIKHSEFGLWLEHKASIVFKSAPELEQIQSRITEVEKSIFPKIISARKNATDARLLMKEIESGVAEIKFLLGGLFDRFIEVESGRDALTRLLNRRHLPSVMTRELLLARKTGVPFTLLMLDIDHFKKINDTFGHDGGDLVLQQVADQISFAVRAGDFVFRIGGEEILILLVEIEQEGAMKVAETIRQRFASSTMRVDGKRTTQITVSIGVASYNGHPDYQTVIKEADDALYEAKNTGRNRCVLAVN